MGGRRIASENPRLPAKSIQWIKTSISFKFEQKSISSRPKTEMEFRLSGNALKTFARSITCLARVGNELAIQASASQLIFHTLNSSRSAYQSITFKSAFFDVYTISATQVQCSVLLKAVCSVLRTPISSIDHLSVHLPDSEASKVQWTLECYSGMRKAYWITCIVEPNIQHLALDKRKFPSNLAARPRDLNRLLANFQSSLQEITVIATEHASVPSDAASEIGGKAVELRSYLDPTKDNDSSLHTQLWIDPSEEFVQYTHTGNPVDVTFGVKELKAFLAFCESCEVDIQLYFEKAGEPLLMAPKFGLDDASASNFDATLVLATMLISQLHEGNPSEPRQAAATTSHAQSLHENGPQPQGRSGANVSEHPSDHTRIWSELSGSAARSSGDTEERLAQRQRNMNATEQRELQRISKIQISKDASATDPTAQRCDPGEKLDDEEARERPETNGQSVSQRHPSNWVDAGEDDDDDDGDGVEMCVQSTPPYYEEQ